MIFKSRRRSPSSTCISFGALRVSRRRVVCLSLVLLKVFGSILFVRIISRPNPSNFDDNNLPCSSQSETPLFDEETRNASLSYLKRLTREFDSANVTYFAFGATHLAAVVYRTLASWDTSVDLVLLTKYKDDVIYAVNQAFPYFHFDEDLNRKDSNIWHIPVRGKQVMGGEANFSSTAANTTSQKQTVSARATTKPYAPFKKSGHFHDFKQMRFSLYFFEENQSKIWLDGTSYSFDKKVVQPLRLTQFEGTPLFVPNDELLSKMYGSDYIKKCLLL